MSGSGVAPVMTAPGPLGGTLAALASTEWVAIADPFNIMLWGAGWTGSVAVERLAPDGTAINCLMPDGTPSAFTINGVIAVPNVWEKGGQYRLTRGAGTGTTSWRFSL